MAESAANASSLVTGTLAEGSLVVGSLLVEGLEGIPATLQHL